MCRRLQALSGLGLFLLLTINTDARAQSWATIDNSGAAPKLEAGQMFYTSMTAYGNGVQFEMAKDVRGIVATCFPQGDDVGDCAAVVKRMAARKFAVTPRPLISESAASGVFYAFGTTKAATRFTVIVYTQ